MNQQLNKRTNIQEKKKRSNPSEGIVWTMEIYIPPRYNTLLPWTV